MPSRGLRLRDAPAAAALALTCLLPSLGCSGLFYLPSSETYSVPSQPPHDVRFASLDGTRLHGWLFDAQTPQRLGMIVQFHGNAANITSHYRSLAWVTEQGYDFFTFDYRGYGTSEGEPSAQGLEYDAIAAMEYALGLPIEHELAPDVILYGQSLGGAVLIHALPRLADRSRIRAVVVEGTFHSYPDIAAGVLWERPVLAPWAGMGYGLVSGRFDPWREVGAISPIPLLVVHDTRDPVIPFGYGAALYRLARQPKRMWAVDQGRHIAAMKDPAVRRAFLAYLRDPS